MKRQSRPGNSSARPSPDRERLRSLGSKRMFIPRSEMILGREIKSHKNLRSGGWYRISRQRNMALLGDSPEFSPALFGLVKILIKESEEMPSIGAHKELIIFMEPTHEKLMFREDGFIWRKLAQQMRPNPLTSAAITSAGLDRLLSEKKIVIRPVTIMGRRRKG